MRKLGSNGFGLAIGVLGLSSVAGCPQQATSVEDILAGTAQGQSLSRAECDSPRADAGADITLSAEKGQDFAFCYLDATTSQTSGGQADFLWSRDEYALAAGQYILVRMPVGTSEVKLTVVDACNQKSSDVITITVNPSDG